jgi:gliding motility-associated-like protein
LFFPFISIFPDLFNIQKNHDPVLLIKRFGLMLCLLFSVFQAVFSQSHISKNNYTGDWETPDSWNPIWTVPQTNISGYNITIDGYITANSSLLFSGTADDLIINDTLVINGDLSLNNKNNVTVNDNGILIIRGNLTVENKSVITANGYLIVTGDFTKNGSVNQASLTSNDDPVKVFIGGTISPPELTNMPNFPALSCTTPPTTPYPNSTCSYGNMTDILNDPINSFFQSTCTIATPTITAGGPTTFCDGGSVTLSSSAGISYLWSNASTTQSINVTTAGSYTVRVTNASGCQSAASLATVVTVNALPTTPTITAGGPTTFCAGGSVTITSSAGTSYLWSNAATTQSINVTTDGSFIVQVTDANGCQSAASVATIVTVNALPVPVINITDNSGIADNDGIICFGETAILTASGGVSYSWSSGETISEIIKDTAGTYTVTVTDANGCQNTDDIAVIVNALPIPVISITDNSGIADNDGIICFGKTAILTASGGASYSWSSGEAVPEITKDIAGTYTVTVTDANGCSSTANGSIIITTKPEADAGTGGDICGQDYTLNATSNSGTGTWTVTSGAGNVTFSPDENDPSATIKITDYGSYQFTWTVVNENCPASSDVTVTFHHIPVANAGIDQKLNNAFTTKMEAELSSYDTGEWSLISGSGLIDNVNSPVSVVSDLSAGENIFLWTVRSESCAASDIVIIEVNDLFVPQVITPNGDIKNDFFVINDIEKNGPVELIIFNRWGNEVYNSTNYLNDWDGRSNNGTELSNDTYFYVLKFANGKITKGFVVIKR